MKYQLSFSNPLTHIIEVRAEFQVSPQAPCTFHLPIWRPGRYEAANYAKNLRNLRFENSQGQSLETSKPQPSTWQVSADTSGTVVAIYEYFAFTMDAGSSWIDDELIYINFVNCLIYDPAQMGTECLISIDIPANYKIATSLEHVNFGKFRAQDYYTLADSPLMAAENLQELRYSVDDTHFHIWSWGTKFSDDSIIESFQRFSEDQLTMMRGFPEPAYHFLLLFLPYKFYHGVEHAASTVICLGPSENLSSDEMMDQLLGVSSHELFHAWNILKIRPRELYPYSYHSRPYFPTGFVAEGFTTYYGDLFLVRSGVRNKEWFLAELGRLFKRHFDNHGRLSLSVVDSSYDLWIDGYQKSAPGRKSSIYVEGAVTALMLDLTIRRKSGGANSLDDVARTLFTDFALQNKGYSLEDIRHLTSKYAGQDLSDFFANYVLGTRDKFDILCDLLTDVGLSLAMKPAPTDLERYLGIRLGSTNNRNKIIQIYPDSPGEKYFSLDDEIKLFNGEEFTPDKFELPEKGLWTFSVQRLAGEKEIQIHPDRSGDYFKIPQVTEIGKADDESKARCIHWIGEHSS